MATGRTGRYYHVRLYIPDDALTTSIIRRKVRRAETWYERACNRSAFAPTIDMGIN